ncbi:NADH:flavin oxidoreductase [Lachnospiraceae bacterium ZAX-1]
MKTMFDSVELGQIKTNSRIVRSATYEMGGGKDGVITPLLKKIYFELTQGGVEVIITGMMGVGNNSRMEKNMIRINDDTFVANFREVADTVHSLDGKLIVQLGHCGIKSTFIDKGKHPYGPSDIEAVPGLPAKAMTKDEIKNLVLEYGIAALKCKEAGADGVQLHSAHGYLISQFLSPYFNKREDEYGDEIENRARLLFEAYNEIRVNVGDKYPVWVKINYTDMVENGLSADDSIWVCKELEKRGLDVIELSSGIAIDKHSRPSKFLKTQEDEGSYVEGALRLSAKLEIPVISTGGFRTPAIIENYLNQGNITAIALCRPFICEPGLLKRWRNGDLENPHCISCNKCYLSKQHGCVQNQ